MTSPVSRDRLDAIQAAYVAGWPAVQPDDVADLLAAAAYALDADDRIAALEAEVARLHGRIAVVYAEGRGEAAEVTAERDELRERVAALEVEVARYVAKVAKVRALCEPVVPGMEPVLRAADVLAALDGEDGLTSSTAAPTRATPDTGRRLPVSGVTRSGVP